MEFLVKKLGDSIVSAGTAGGFALVILLLMIYSYFKYLMPYLEEFYKIKGKIDNFEESHSSQNEILKVIIQDLERLNALITQTEKDMSRDIQNEATNNYKGMVNQYEKLEKQVQTLIDRSSGIKERSEKDHQEILIEIAKLQTRLEFMNQSGTRGLQK